jgi:hypothetical protein
LLGGAGKIIFTPPDNAFFMEDVIHNFCGSETRCGDLTGLGKTLRPKKGAKRKSINSLLCIVKMTAAQQVIHETTIHVESGCLTALNNVEFFSQHTRQRSW